MSATIEDLVGPIGVGVAGSGPVGGGPVGGGPVGVGLDVVDVDLFAEQLDVPGTSFALGAFTAGERADVTTVRDGATVVDVRRLAARFAAKEAFVKAWANSRFGRAPLLDDWAPTDIEVVHDTWGRSRLRLHGDVAAAVRDHLGEHWTTHLSLSHDGPVAAAVVVLSGTGQGDTGQGGIGQGRSPR